MHTVTFKAEDSNGATSTQSVIYNVTAATLVPNMLQLAKPETFLRTHPLKTIKTTKNRVKVKFGFSANISSATFKCKLDKGAFASCVSPKTYKVKPGKHTFAVQAVHAGRVDETPATFSFKVVKRP